MKNKLIALETELELNSISYHTTYDKYISELDKIINKWFIEPNDAITIRRWTRCESWNKNIVICFEIGFHNNEEDRIDFGSDISFSFDSKENRLTLNYGTIGTHGKENIYQFKRIKLISYVYDNIDFIETELKTFSDSLYPLASDYENKRWDIEHQISAIKHELAESEKQSIRNKLTVGNTLAYYDNCKISYFDQLFHTPVKIVSETPEFVKVNVGYNENIKIRKRILVELIFNNHMEIIEE